MTSSTAEVTITIRDVNDEAPTFNQQEYRYYLAPANRIASSIITIRDVNDEAPNFNQQEYRYYILLQPIGSLLALSQSEMLMTRSYLGHLYAKIA
jgi:hypothetical protein